MDRQKTCDNMGRGKTHNINKIEMGGADELIQQKV